jgi:hypothetical protein
MPEAVASQLSPGAGRYRDYCWPDPALNTSAPALNVGNRIGASSPNGGKVGYGGGAGNDPLGVWKGVNCAQILSTAVGGNAYVFDVMAMHVKNVRQAIPPSNDDEACYRIYCNMAAQNTPNAGQEYGFNMIRRDTNGRILQDNAWGFGIRFVDVNTAEMLINGPNGLVRFNVFAGDVTAWHSYEFRVQSATATADATLQLRIDGVVVALAAVNSTWGAGTNLPGNVLSVGRSGFCATLQNNSGLVNSLFVSALRFISGPTPLSLL